MRQIIKQLLLLIAICLIILFILIKKSADAEGFNEKTWAIVQYDDRDLKENEKALTEITQKYAAAHNYDYIFLKDGYNHLPPYWVKVAAVRDILKQGKHKGVCWIDTDATFVNHEKSIDEFCNVDPSAAFLMAKDAPIWNNGSFNAGVWFVRNNIHGNAIMDKWMAAWDTLSKDWVKEGNSWKCNGPWSGPSYEQGAFYHTIFTNNEHNKYVKQLSYDYLQSIDPKLENAFTVHFSGTQKNAIPAFLTSWTK